MPGRRGRGCEGTKLLPGKGSRGRSFVSRRCYELELLLPLFLLWLLPERLLLLFLFWLPLERLLLWLPLDRLLLFPLPLLERLELLLLFSGILCPPCRPLWPMIAAEVREQIRTRLKTSGVSP